MLQLIWGLGSILGLELLFGFVLTLTLRLEKGLGLGLGTNFYVWFKSVLLSQTQTRAPANPVEHSPRSDSNNFLKQLSSTFYNIKKILG